MENLEINLGKIDIRREIPRLMRDHRIASCVIRNNGAYGIKDINRIPAHLLSSVYVWLIKQYKDIGEVEAA